MNKILVLTCLFGVCFAQTKYGSGYSSSQFGAAGFRANIASLRSQYSPRGSQYSAQNSENEPAKYDFKYDVNDQQYGVELGHQEQRDGDNTRGTYYVLLPDGRRQIVQYTVDADGYHPVISYQDTSANGRNNGYQSSRKITSGNVYRNNLRQY